MMSNRVSQHITESISKNINQIWFPLKHLCTSEDHPELLTLVQSTLCSVIYVPVINNTYITSHYLNSSLGELFKTVVTRSLHEMPIHNNKKGYIRKLVNQNKDIRLLIVQIRNYNEDMEATTTYPALLLFRYDLKNDSTTTVFVGVRPKMTWTDPFDEEKSHDVSRIRLGA